MNSQARSLIQSKIALWLGFVCTLIVMMVVVGGVTRLTGSGLSIVDWKPIMGAIPPLNSDEWNAAFEKYQNFPQYKLLNSSMTLSEFKGIFFWEYIHRLLGRFIGLVFFFPVLYFSFQNSISRELKFRLWIGFFLGGLQGALGWFMVKSGLVDMPQVSHLRLAAHLSLALFVLGYLFWTRMSVLGQPVKMPLKRMSMRLEKLRASFGVFFILLVLQIIYGAFVAGMRAGHIYNTFPTMNGEWFPSQFFIDGQGWQSIFYSSAAVQFIHRCLGIALWGLSIWIFIQGRKLIKRMTVEEQLLNREPVNAANRLFTVTQIQFALGLMTLLYNVPIAAASLHQLTGCILLLVTLYSGFHMRRFLRASNVLKTLA